MKKIGIIDIGSNSMRLVVIKINDDLSYRVIDEKKETVKLGMDMTYDGNLSRDRVDKAMISLSFFKDMCIAIGVDEIIAVATEAVRRARNQQYFVERAKDMLGIEIKVLSGKEEAFYDYFGAVNTLDFNDALIMDIGGCSNQLILVKDKKIIESVSLPFGSLNLSEKFHLKEAVNEQNENDFITYLADEYNKIPWLNKAKGLPLIGIGGTIRGIGKINRKRNHYLLEMPHNYKMEIRDIKDIYELVKSKDVSQKQKLKGLSKDRADIFTGAVGAIAHLAELCEASEILVSGSGLREGLFFEYLFKDKKPLTDVLDYSINNIVNDFELDKLHAQRVWSFSKMLYFNLKDAHNIGEAPQKILKTASLLHDCGVNISYYDHHRHSFYMILNAKTYGLTHKEQLMAAHISAFHRKEEFKIDTYKYRNILNEADILTIQKLGVLLKISECLDERLNGNIQGIQCSIDEDSVTIKLSSKDNPEIEIKDALEVSSAFKKLFGKKLYIK
ncbi:exopolyphosphatase [Oxobacter pfennigii]|uniref:Exopolyphosphatase n=1 Tax=Oxobacter pfennigii TaxID=36849 RepID=A0A0P8WVS5_9CLOT|nr:Ppx/GppA phosphatase family protein [Oxobacter pfennigii]KPU42363.1 exopolyphosphatase [Oxobacter pfennigii]